MGWLEVLARPTRWVRHNRSQRIHEPRARPTHPAAAVPALGGGRTHVRREKRRAGAQGGRGHLEGSRQPTPGRMGKAKPEVVDEDEDFEAREELVSKHISGGDADVALSVALSKAFPTSW